MALALRCHGNQSCSAAGSNWELEEKDGKERKKEIEKEGVFQLERGRKVVPIVRTTNAGSLFYDRFMTSLTSKTFNIINKWICFDNFLFFLSSVFWRHSCTPCTSWSAVDPNYAIICVHFWRFISMVTAPSVTVHFRSKPVDGDVESHVSLEYTRKPLHVQQHINEQTCSICNSSVI